MKRGLKKMRLRLNFKYLIIIILVIGLLSGCIYGKKEDDIEDIKSNYMSSINNDIRDHEIKKFIKGDLNFKKLDIEEKNNDMVLYNFHLEVNFQEDLLDIPDNDVAKVRSEERRVGKECRSRWLKGHE